MIIKEGFNSCNLQIKISGRKYGNAEMWLLQEGLPEEVSRYQETLSYVSLQELIDLKQEIDRAIKVMTSLE